MAQKKYPTCELHGKTAYPTQRSAFNGMIKAALSKHARGKPLRVYPAPGCGSWHITSTPKHKNSRKKLDNRIVSHD